MSFQLPLFVPDSDWTPPDLSDLPSSWGDGRVAIDTETCDPLLTKLGPGVRRGGFIAGVALAFEDGPSFYLPVRHGDGGNMDPAAVMSYLRSCAAGFTGTLVGANLGYDLDFLEEEGVTFPQVQWFRDVQVADPLINELHNNYSLDAIAARHGVPGKDQTLLMQALADHGFRNSKAKSGIWALHSRFVGAYGEQDARLPLTLLRRQERTIDEEDLWNVYNLESRVLPVLVKMRRRGVAVDENRLAYVDSWAREQQQLAVDAANHTLPAGVRLSFSDVSNTNVLGRVLTSLGIDLPKTRTGKDSVTAAVLDAIDHPVGDHLRRARKMVTLRSTFVGGVREHLVRGRAHCTFNQLRRNKDDESGDTEGAAYGRLSSANFNFQNQPARDEEIGPLWRSIYVPDGADSGNKWAALDYSQQEPRQAVHSAIEAGPEAIGQAAFDSAMEAARRYREDPTMDFHDMMTRMINGDDYLEQHGKDAFKQKRKYAKNIFLGLSYGMGGAKLCHDLGMPSAWRISWSEGRRRRFKDYQTRGDAVSAAERGRAKGYDVRYWETAGEEGQALIDTFDRQVPFVRKMANHMQDVAGRQGYIVTLLGRRCHFPEKGDGGWDWLHKAFNRRIQGGSADQTKQALVEMDAEGLYVQLQVHDEIDGSMTPEEARRGADIMENAVKLHVPMKVDVELGDSWGDSM